MSLVTDPETLVQDPEFRKNAEVLHRLMLAANGTRYLSTVDELTWQMAQCVVASMRLNTAYATGPGFIAWHGPIGWMFAAVGAEVSHNVIDRALRMLQVEGT